jgi:hypothetical protein
MPAFGAVQYASAYPATPRNRHLRHGQDASVGGQEDEAEDDGAEAKRPAANVQHPKIVRGERVGDQHPKNADPGRETEATPHAARPSRPRGRIASTATMTTKV